MIYFDYAASAPLDSRVREAMAAADATGNPSSLHAFGRSLRSRIDRARLQVARLFGCEAGEIVFTSGATESNVAAVEGLVRLAAPSVRSGVRPHVLASPVEHPSVIGALERLAGQAAVQVEFLKVDREGRVSADDVVKRLREETVLVCVMWANNVLGTIQPVAEIGRAVAAEKERRGRAGSPLFFFSDSVQAVSTLSVLPAMAGVDAISFSSHKMYGPKGAGGLYVRKGLAIPPLLAGGEQESGIRPGTENVGSIVGLGAAAAILLEERAADAVHALKLRAELISKLQAPSSKLRSLSPEQGSVPGIVYLQSPKDDGETLAMKLDVAGFAVSTGSACAAGSRKPSHVIAAAYDENTARRGGIRVSFGRFTTEEEVRSLARACSMGAPRSSRAVPAPVAAGARETGSTS